ncbi:MAG: amino acid adenylation domain-containing protein, partial [Acidobacteria bacterium]|nr:amino acid adenylation domain-containing protein [Acidobacteriota bacterium]
MSSGTSRLEGLSPQQMAQLIERLRPAAAAVEGIPRLSRDGAAFAVSTAQERLWFLHRVDRRDTAYTLCAMAVLRGALRWTVLDRALARLRERHEVLRTVFVDTDDGPRQLVSGTVAGNLPLLDLTALEAMARRRLASDLARRLAGEPFDLATGPLFRSWLLRLEPLEHRLVLELHHVVCDAWSMGLLVRDLATLYGGTEGGGAGALPRLPVQYVDYAAWERSRIESPQAREQLEAACAELAGAPVVEVAADRRRPAVRSSRGHRVALRLPAAELVRLRGVAEAAGATLFGALAASLALLLEHHGAGCNLVIGTPVANRRRTELAHLVGFLVNTLPLRLRVAPDKSFAAHLAAVTRVVARAMDRQEVPFDQLVERLVPERSLAHPPLVQVMLALDEAPAALELSGLRVEIEDVANDTAKLDLLWQLRIESDGSLGGWLEASADLFDATTARRIASRFAALLGRVGAAPEAPVGRLPRLTPGERQCLLYEWSGRTLDGAGGLLVDGFLETARCTPEAAAVTGRTVSLTYSELDQASHDLAMVLKDLGAGAETLVAVRMDRTPALVVALLAVLRSGAAYVPIDPAYPVERQRFLVEDSGAGLVLTDRSEAAPVEEDPFAAAVAGQGSGTLRRVVLGSRGEVLSAPSPSPAARAGTGRLPTIRPEQLAYLIYTSGSTGRPKAVAIEHRNAAALLGWAHRCFDASELARVAATTSASFDLSVFELFAPLTVGGSVLVLRDALELAEPGRGAESSGPTLINTVPSAFAELLEQGFGAPGPTTVNLAGEALRGALVDRIYELGGVVRVCNLYGPSEDTTYSTWSVVPAAPEGRGTGGEPTIGRSVDGGRGYVVDGALRAVPVGVTGEIVLGGAGLARGYYHRPRLTAERFVPDPFGDGERLYRTGDLGRFLADGQLEYLGRRDQQVKVRGFRIELGEIEVALGELPGVVEAAVVAVGELSERRLVAFLRLDSEKGWAPETLLARLRGRLPEPLVPTELRPVEALPLTANRKIDRIELRRRAVEERRREAGGVSYRSPRNPLEELLVTLFADLLDRPRVGIDESFFALGGHSLLAARLASRLARALEREVPVPWVFEAPTAARLAARIEHAERRALPPLVPGARPARLPLSPAQERLWFLDRLQPGEAVYHLPMVLDLVGPLDAGALERALLDVVGRHEVLRTRFVEETPGVPAQRVEAVPGSMLARIDVSGAEGLAAELEASWARQPFDLAHRLPLRAVLLRRSEERSSLCLVAHHIAVDGVSLGVLFDELARSYEARLAGRPAELPEVPVQAADHAVWQRQGLRGELLETLLEDARRRLAGAPEVLDLPFDGPAPAVSTNRGETVPVPLPPGTGERLRALARDTRSTPFAVLAAVFETALWRWSGQRDLLLGTPVAQRERAELERAVGLYVNTLVLRGVLDAGTPFREQVAATQRAFLDAYAGRELPFEELVRALGEHRDLGSSPIFQVLLVLQQEVPEPRFSGLETALRPLDVGAARFDLTLAAAFRGGELEAVLELRTDRFESTTRRRLAAQLGRLLTASLAGPDLTLEALELLAPAERQQLLVEWQPGTAARGGLAGDLWGAFAAQAVRRPDAPAVRWGVEVWSYRRLAGLAAEIGGRLLDLGVSTEDVVAVGAARTPRTIAALLGVLRVGGAYLPLDPAYPAARLRAMLDDSGARVAVCDACLEPLLREAAVDVVDLSALSGGEDTSTSAWAEPPNPAIDPRQLAYLIYTSGSTGRAKAVAIEHRSALALLRWSADVFSDDELAGVLAVTSLCFDLSVFELFVPLCRGGTVVLVDDALALSELAAEVPVTLVNTVPSALAAVLKLGGLPTSVETVNLAGEPLRRELVRALRAGSDVRRVWNLYGPSEDTTYSTAARVPLDGAAEPTIGRAVMGSRALVLHDARRLVPLGAVGELCLAGEGLARGYLGQPRRTAESFVPDSLSALPGERLYRTGDLARWGTDGELRFLGRRDHQVKVRGFRVELAEIEVALGRFPEVEEAVVVAVTGSDGSSQLVAYVAAPEGSPGAEELRRRLARQLPPPLVPSRIVVLKGLPHTLTGKIDRRALPAPDLEAGGGTDSEPASAVEEVMVGLFEQALDRRSVGLEDDFFALGGHSLLAVRLVARIREVFGVSLPVRTVFEHPTVRGVARRLEAARRGAEASSVTAPRSGSVPDPAPASWIQERLWFLERLGTDPGAYAMPLALDLEGRLDALALEAALHRVIGRHDVLRTVFDSLDGRPYQRVLAAIPVALPRLDLAGLEEPDRKEVMTRDLERLISAGFDLAAGPLFRMLLVRAGEARHRLLLVAHHAVFDGWSGGLLLREIGAFYRASTRTLEAGDGFREPEPLPLQYADFAVWQRRQGDRHREGLAFYRELLDGAPAVLDLPVDHLHSASAPLRGGLESLRLGAESGARLQALCRRQGVTPFLLLTAAWATILARWSGQRDVVLGAPVSIRDHRDLEPLIGAFLNTLVLRVEIDPASTFAELLAQVRERFLAAYEHRDLPFERLLDELGVERSLERTPLFQVFVNMLSFPAQSLDLPDLTVTVPPPPLPPPKFDLTLYARLADERLEVDLVYDARRFAASTMAEMVHQLGGVLEQIAEGPETPVLALSLRTPEARQVLPDPTRPLSRTWRGPVHRFFARQVQATPERPAVIEDGGESWSYAELYEAVEAVAATLHERGAGPGERVLIFAHRGAALVAAIVGTLRSGAAFSIVDPAYPGERLVAACKRVQPRLLLALEAAGPVPPELLAAVRDSGAAILVLGRRRAEILAALSRGTAPEPDLGPDSPAYVGL